MDKGFRKLKRSVIKEEFVALVGDSNSAVILNQMVFWQTKTVGYDRFKTEQRPDSDDEDRQYGWFWKKAAELVDETFLSISHDTVRRILIALEAVGYIESRRNPRSQWDKVLQYRVKLDKLDADLKAIGYSLDGFTDKPENFANQIRDTQ